MLKKLLLPIAGLLFGAAQMRAAEPVVMPDGIEPTLYEDREGNQVYVAIDGDEIYFQGLSTRYPEFTVKGSFNGSVASIKQWQYVQNYGGLYDIYTCFNTMDYNEDDELVFFPTPPDFEYKLTVNLSAGTISCEKEDAFTLFGFVTMVEDEWQWVDYQQNIYLKEYVDYTGVPVNPTGLEVEKYDGDDFYSFMFTLPLKTTNGNPLSIYDTYYVIYVNNEEYTFVPDEDKGIYEGVPEPITEMPAYYSNGNDIVANGEGHLVGLYVDKIESVGVQTVYKYGGQVNSSEIISIGEAGIESIGADVEVVNVEYFDLAGRKIVNPSKGVYIKRQKLSDGTTRSEKTVL